MRLVIAGSRKLRLYEAVEVAVRRSLEGWGVEAGEVRRVLSGRCPFGGADALGERWAAARGVEVEPHPPKGGRGPARFHARNRDMARACDGAVVLLSWPGRRDPQELLNPRAQINRGSLSMLRELGAAGVRRVGVWAVDEAGRRLRRLE